MAVERKVNREYRDRLFKLVFQEKKDLLDLYNAINHTAYENPDDMEVNTLEDVVYMNMKNDKSFLIKDVLNLYEHQSTVNPNLPLRGLFYFAELYRKIVGDHYEIYSSKRIRLPYPQFIVFYNGTVEQPEYQVLQLHDAFPPEYEKEEAALQCRAIMLNINLGYQSELLSRCKKLKEYAIFIERIRQKQREKKSILEAVEEAMEECISEGVLEEVLKNHREEVCSVKNKFFTRKFVPAAQSLQVAERGWMWI